MSSKPDRAYLVSLTLRAQRDLALLFHEKNAEHSEATLKWYRGLKDAILSLEDHPSRCPATPEKPGLRHLRYGQKPHIYPVIYRIKEKPKQVDVLPIRHGARNAFRSSEAR